MSDFNDVIFADAIPAPSHIAPATSQSFTVSNFGTTNITTIKLIGSTNYLLWAAYVKMRFKGPWGLKGKAKRIIFNTKAESVPKANRVRWEQVDA